MLFVPESAACFFEHNVPWLVKHFARLSGDQMLAEDLVQEACIVVLQRFGPEGVAKAAVGANEDAVTHNPRSYLFGVVRRLYLGNLRKEARRATQCMAEPPELPAADDVFIGVAQAQDRRWLQHKIGRLSRPRDRALLTRLALCEQDKASICDALELSARHYDRVLSRALERLTAA